MGSPALLSRAAHLISSTQQRLNACPAEKKQSSGFGGFSGRIAPNDLHQRPIVLFEILHA